MNKPVESTVDPFSMEVLLDPWPALAEIREAAPAVWLPAYQTWIVARHAEVSHGLRDHATFCSSAGVGLTDFRKEPPWRPPSIVLEADPPDHTRARKVLADVLSPVNVRSMRDTFEKVADEMVADLVDAGTVDAMERLATAYPLRVFPDAVGLVDDGRHHLLAYGNMVFNSFGPRNELFERATADIGPTRDWIMAQCSVSQLSDDGLGAQIYAAAERGEISVDEAGMLLRSFLSAGVDTTVSSFAAVLWLLATNPGQFERLRADPTLARSAFEEAVRLEAPVQSFFRTTTCDTELGGVPMTAGTKVLLSLAGANRDPRRFASPDTFDITRRTVGHVGWGFGIHVCVGAVVARLEAEAVLGALARRVRSISLTGTPLRRVYNTMRSFSTLPMSFTS